MIRTVVFRCHLSQKEADALNRESGRIYSRVMVEHYRIYRKKGIWLNNAQAEKLDDVYHGHEAALLHSHSIDASQQGFYKACKTAKTNKADGLPGARYPHKRKHYRTTVWKNTGIRLKDNRTKAERKAQKGQRRFVGDSAVLLLARCRSSARRSTGATSS